MNPGSRLQIEEIPSKIIQGLECDAVNCREYLGTTCWYSPFAEDVFYHSRECAETAPDQG